MSEVTKEEFNELGSRVSVVEVGMSKVCSETDRNKDDIQRLWLARDDDRKTVSKIPWQVMGIVSIPSLLILYQILTK